MIAWMLGAFAGPVVLAGFAVYLCRGPCRRRCLTRDQIAELEGSLELIAQRQVG
jgi:hypothetical protein